MGEMIDDIWLPQALSIGVDYNVFWNLSPKRLEPFFKAQKQIEERLNKNNWILGIYIQKSIASAFSKNNKYPDQPIDIFGNTSLSDEERFEMWATVANKEFERNQL